MYQPIKLSPEIRDSIRQRLVKIRESSQMRKRANDIREKLRVVKESEEQHRLTIGRVTSQAYNQPFEESAWSLNTEFLTERDRFRFA